MRGKGQSGAGQAESTGITPAYAGKSVPRKMQLLQNEDHPRLCGEKSAAIPV